MCVLYWLHLNPLVWPCAVVWLQNAKWWEQPEKNKPVEGMMKICDFVWPHSLHTFGFFTLKGLWQVFILYCSFPLPLVIHVFHSLGLLALVAAGCALLQEDFRSRKKEENFHQRHDSWICTPKPGQGVSRLKSSFRHLALRVTGALAGQASIPQLHWPWTSSWRLVARKLSGELSMDFCACQIWQDVLWRACSGRRAHLGLA